MALVIKNQYERYIAKIYRIWKIYRMNERYIACPANITKYFKLNPTFQEVWFYYIYILRAKLFSGKNDLYKGGTKTLSWGVPMRPKTPKNFKKSWKKMLTLRVIYIYWSVRVAIYMPIWISWSQFYTHSFFFIFGSPLGTVTEVLILIHRCPSHRSNSIHIRTHIHSMSSVLDEQWHFGPWLASRDEDAIDIRQLGFSFHTNNG